MANREWDYVCVKGAEGDLCLCGEMVALNRGTEIVVVCVVCVWCVCVCVCGGVCVCVCV